MENHKDELQQVGQRTQEARKALRQAETAEAFDEGAIRAASNGLSSVTDGAVLRAKVRSEVMQALTPEQQAKAAQLRGRARAANAAAAAADEAADAGAAAAPAAEAGGGAVSRAGPEVPGGRERRPARPVRAIDRRRQASKGSGPARGGLALLPYPPDRQRPAAPAPAPTRANTVIVRGKIDCASIRTSMSTACRQPLGERLFVGEDVAALHLARGRVVEADAARQVQPEADQFLDPSS